MPQLQTLYQINAKAISANGQTDPLPCGAIETLEIDITVSALKSGCTANFTYYRQDSFGNLYPVWTAGVSTTGALQEDIGKGMNVPHSPGSAGVFAWSMTGSSPTATFSAMLQGR